MAGKIILDEIEKSSTGTGIKLNSPLLSNTGVQIISESGTLGSTITFPSTIDNTTLGSNVVMPSTIDNTTLGSGVTFPAGHVIKTEMTTAISGSTTSSTDVSIATPSFTTTVANSKVYIMMTLLCRATSSGSNDYIYVKFFHDTTLLLNGYPIVGNFNSTDVRGVAAWNYLYSPNVAAGTTLNFNVTINATYASSTVYVSSSTTPSHITFMEIAP
jgi:hypothetical protein